MKNKLPVLDKMTEVEARLSKRGGVLYVRRTSERLSNEGFGHFIKNRRN